MGDSHNFFIGDLGFHKAVNPERPYERATAPFRKEQFDAAPTVGDQSLSGWWTRGQLSFHKGAGVEYYEVLDGDEVLNRFHTSDSIDPTIPGEVQLSPAVVPAATVQVAATAVPMAVGLERTATGNLEAIWVEYAASWTIRRRSGGSVSTVTLSSGSPAPYLASDSDSYYAVKNSPNGIERIERGTSSGSEIYTHSTNILGLWHAKDRLWVLDAVGAIYALAPRPATSAAIGSADLVFRVPDGESSYDAWCFAAGPAAVYFGFKNRIYKVQPENDGAVPTLTAGVVVAQLAEGEVVRSMHYALGHLVVGTSEGVRAAIVQGDGSLTYGPLIVRGRGVGKTAGALGSSVYMLLDDVPKEPAGVRLVRVNLEQPILDLTFAYSTTSCPLDYNLLSSNDTPGVSAGGGGVVVFGTLGGGAVLDLHEATGDSPTLSTEGEVVTGYHRFGTLEGKHFSGVKVRAGGDGGTIDAYLVGLDGSETFLTTVDLAAETGAEVTLVNNPPSEAMALRFVLKPSALDATVGPKLFGYQLKALPSPVRQRLIRVPLMMFDVERGPTGRSVGAEKSAWTRLQALELAEEEDALTPFEDKDTGEAGTAFIESVELFVQNGSKGNARSNGFGGIVMVTLRKVA